MSNCGFIELATPYTDISVVYLVGTEELQRMEERNECQGRDDASHDERDQVKHVGDAITVYICKK